VLRRSGGARTTATRPTDRRSVVHARVRLRTGADSACLGVGARWGAGDLRQGEPRAAHGLGRHGRRAERATSRRATLCRFCFAGAMFEIAKLKNFVQKSTK
jgi:hypothetical protein